MRLGYSTGSLAYGDFRKAIVQLKQTSANSIELSALREGELKELINSIDSLDLDTFTYISFHAPSKLKELSEEKLISHLKNVAKKGWPIVVHPDIITDINAWRELGEFLCIENMDKRKPVGRTSYDLEQIFNCFPEATFCLDLAHSKQIDPTMLETKLMLRKFSDRLSQVHLSVVNSNSVHEQLNTEAIITYRKIAKLIPEHIPIILESPKPSSIESELKMASYIFDEHFELALSPSIEVYY